MNEWGIPDWRVPSAYGDVERWKTDRWRWEFYRRRDDLRAFFDRWADDPEVRNLRCNKGRLPSEPGYLAFGNGGEKGEAIRRFDYGGVPNPRIGDQPAMSIMPCEKIFYRMRFFNPIKRRPLGLSVREALGERIPRQYELYLHDHEYAVSFDLNEPLQPQIEYAVNVLKRNQKALHGRLVQKRRHKSKWLGYLRTLDAREAGASWAEIAIIHPATAHTGQTARDIWDAASALRFNF